MGSDKRKSQRVHTNQLVSYTKFTPEKLVEVMGMANTVDLSEEGMKLTLRDALTTGDVIHLDFVLDGKVIKTDATVVHVEEVKHYKIGFQFIPGEGDHALDPHEADKIREWLQTHTFANKSKDETI